ncbi:hypothetical protein, conserved [Babesia bigemina]|uniref:Uncharacterized protein n=1 Tax=Babesia bigemina TaxID=5866 RepID=A0A061BJA5_BABBI|nr:hypothetical protein, conserved [Babesia bigemina]CDR71574.1 hypothetical protein, conserved [Babesia bigemina]|eukprot:XP_012770520.1 hypothetical protein, conserved [Babesia bigemina]
MTSINLYNNLLILTILLLTMLLKKPCRTLTPRLSSLVTLLGDSVKKAVENAIIAQINSNEELIKLYSSLVTNLSVSVNPAGQTDDTAVIGPLQVEVSKKIAEITDQITQLEQQNKLNNHSLPSPSPSAELAKLHSKLEALKEVEKLCGFLTNSNKQQNNPTNNILTHLCDGLETFLGFSSDSKGYTGSGIVYSDLDRLCDGVMGFLNGVLSNIHKHLGQHKSTLDSAINILNTNKQLGKNGFNAAIGEVVAGVRGYNDAVMKSNKKVSDVLTKMQKDADKYSAERLEKLLPPRNADDPVKIGNLIEAANETVAECLKKADEFNTALDMKNNAEELRNAMKDLNPNLITKIENVRENIKHESKRLNKLAEHEKNDLHSMEAEIKTKLHDVKCKVNEHIKKKVKDLVERLKDRVREMQTKLVDINVDLTKHLEKLEKWMKDVKKFIDEHPRVNAQKILEEIKWDNGGDTNVKRNKIDNAARELRMKAEELFRAGEAAKKTVQEKVSLALTQVITMNDALKQDLWKVKANIKKAVVALGKTLETNVKQDLTTLKGKIKSGLHPIVGGVETFSKQFAATKQAIDGAIQALHGDVGRLKELENVGTADMKFIHAFRGNNDPFQKLKVYFKILDEEVMSKLQTGITKIGEQMLERLASYAGGNNLQDELRKSPIKDGIAEALKSLSTVNTLDKLPDLTEVKTLLGNILFDDFKKESNGRFLK